MESVFDKIAENRRVSELRFLAEERKKENEKELFRERLQFIQKQVHTRPANEQRKFLERYVEENLEFLDSVVGYSVNAGRSSPYTDKIKADIKKAGGLIPFYKKKAGNGIAWSFTDWQIGHGWLWLLQEIVKLYDLLSTDAAPPQTETREERRALIDKKGESAPKAVDHAELLKKKGVEPTGSLIKCLEHLTENGWIEANPNFPDREESPYRIPSSEAAYNVARYQKEQKPSGMKASEFGGLFYYDGKPFDIESRRSNLGKKKTKP